MKLQDAMNIAKTAHEGQVDKQGEAYYWHVYRVGIGAQSASRTVAENEALEKIGLLHDVLEDTSLTREDLVAAGAEEEIIEGGSDNVST